MRLSHEANIIKNIMSDYEVLAKKRSKGSNITFRTKNALWTVPHPPFCDNMAKMEKVIRYFFSSPFFAIPNGKAGYKIENDLINW